MATLTSHRHHHPVKRRSDFSIRRAPPATTPNRNPSNKICVYWLQGRCTRNSCKFLHPDPDHQPTTTAPDAPKGPTGSLCRYWASPSSTCAYGDECRFLHSWHRSVNGAASFSMRARLTGGHAHPVTGIALPAGSNCLVTAAEDGTVVVWDSDTGKPAREVNLGARAGRLISEGPWVFIGLNGAVRAWRVDDERVDVTFTGPVGHVTALSTSDDTLFAGSEDGSIHAWKFINNNNDNGPSFHPLPPSKSNGRPVVSLHFGAGQLFSGSADGTIRVLDPNDLKCLQTLEAHDGAVSALICWDKFLLSSSSLDGRIRIWGATETGDLSSVYTHKEEGGGVVSMFGMVDLEAKSVLYSSCEDNVVRLYDLPSFRERGRIFANGEVGAIQRGSDGLGLFFTGDGTGVVSVWQWAGN